MSNYREAWQARSDKAGRPCTGTGKLHRDAMMIVEFLMDQDGEVTLTNEEIARRIGFLKKTGRGIFLLDSSRFQRARQHINDGRSEIGKPCCHYNVNYRRSGPRSTLALIDPDGGIEDHWRAALAEVLGLLSRMRQHQTEDGRCSQQLEDLSDFALARGDKDGYRVCQRAVIDLDHYGTIHSDTLGSLILWAEHTLS